MTEALQEDTNLCYKCTGWSDTNTSAKAKCKNDCDRKGWTVSAGYTCPSFKLKRNKQFALDL